MTTRGRSALLDGLAAVIVTILVWGVNAFQRGLWQDDTQVMGEAFERSMRAHPFLDLFQPMDTPLRRLAVLPTAIAHATTEPIAMLHVLSAAIWLAHGLLAGWIVGLLLPDRRWTRFAVVCLTLTATSDYTTGSIVPLAYNTAALMLLVAVGCALRWLRDGGPMALTASAALLAASLLTMDVALPAVPLLALLFVLIGGRETPRRVAGLLAAWSLVLVPIAIAEWTFLHDPESYAAIALRPLTPIAFVKRSLSLWLTNLTPWSWPFDRPVWYAPSGAVISVAWMIIGSTCAAAVVLFRLRTKEDRLCEDDRADDRWRGLWLAALFLLMALMANAAYAGVQFSDLHYRTHILSRIWSSLAIGIAAGMTLRMPRLRTLADGVVIAFVFLGTWGGMERQDFFLGTWQRHQRELASILAAAPSVRPGTAIILRGSSSGHLLMATEADYLAQHWLRLLYNDPHLRTLRLDPTRGSACQPAAGGGVDCWPEGQRACRAAGTCAPTAFRLDTPIVMDYDPRTHTYALVRSLANDPLAGVVGEAARYRPDARIVARPLSARQQRLLLID